VLIFLIFIFVAGLCVGSFLNVLIYRLPRGKPVIFGRSFCPKCKRKIAWFDNLPLLSFFLLKGRCRSCQQKISWRYPLVELLTGVLFVLEVSNLGNLSNLGALGLNLVLISSSIVIFFVDLELQIIPDEILIFDVLIAFFFLISQSRNILISNLLVALLSAVFFLLLHLVTRGRGMGFGDVKLAFLIGLSLGFPKSILAFYLAFLTGALVGIILIVIGKAKFGRPIPFGPFLVLGLVTVLFMGEKLLWFLSQIYLK